MTGFKSRNAQNGHTTTQKPNFQPFSAQERLRNGWGTAKHTAEKRLSARLPLLLDLINDRGKFHSHRTRHLGRWAELVWYIKWRARPRVDMTDFTGLTSCSTGAPRAVVPCGILKCPDPACTHPKIYHNMCPFRGDGRFSTQKLTNLPYVVQCVPLCTNILWGYNYGCLTLSHTKSVPYLSG